MGTVDVPLLNYLVEKIKENARRGLDFGGLTLGPSMKKGLKSAVTNNGSQTYARRILER